MSVLSPDWRNRLTELDQIVEIMNRYRQFEVLCSRDLERVLNGVFGMPVTNAGHFGVVFKLDGGRVLKVSFAPTDSYPLFVKWVQAQPDKRNLPEFLEVLELPNLFCTVMPEYVPMAFGSGDCESDETRWRLEERLEREMGDVCLIDCHMGNWMWRDSTRTEPVLVDGLGYMRNRYDYNLLQADRVKATTRLTGKRPELKTAASPERPRNDFGLAMFQNARLNLDIGAQA